MDRHQWVFAGLVTGLVIVIIIMVTFLQVDRKDEYETVDYLIGVSHANLVEEWQIALHNDMKKQANEFSHIKLISTNAGNSSFQQIDDVNKLKDYGIDLLIISVNEVGALESTIEEISGEIPVILLDKSVDGADYALHISPNYYDIGLRAANRFDRLSAGSNMHILTINGSIEDESAIQMNQGFMDGSLQSGHIVISDQIYVDWLEPGYRDFLNKTLEEQLYNGIYIQSTELVLDVMETLKSLGKKVPVVVSGKYISDKYLTYLDIGDIDTLIYTPLGATEALNYGLSFLENKMELGSIPKRITMNSFTINKEDQSPVRSTERNFSKKIGFIGTDLFDENNILHDLSSQYEMIFYERKGEDSEQIHVEQIKEFRELMDQNVDMIIIQPEKTKGWDNLMEEAVTTGVRVIILGNKQVYDRFKVSDNMVYIGPDYDDQSIRMTNYLINQVYSTEYDIGILEVTDLTETAGTNKKSESLSQQISGYSRINVITKISLDASEVDSDFKEALQLAFNRYEDDINVIYLHNDLFADRLEEAMGQIRDEDLVIIGSNDTGILQDNPFIDFQVTTELIYEDQLLTMIDSLYETGYWNVAEIYLPNRSQVN